MADVQREIKLAECENLIKQIRDVISVNIVLGQQKQIEEIHVLAEENRNAKQLVRDIETLLRVEYGIEVDHKKISVVQLNKGQKVSQEKRLKFSSIAYTLHGSQLEAVVELATASNTCQGRCCGLNSKRNSVRLFALATIDALSSLLDEGSSISLEDIALYSLGSQNIISCALTYIRGSSEEYLVGSAIIRQDDKEAVVRATLNAINRRVSFEI